MTDTIRAALEAAAKRLCICDGECFETRHGMMHGPCERKMGKTAAAVAAFLRQMYPVACGDGFTFAGLADAVERAAGAHGWRCPINSPGCTRNCGSYGCGN
jgi:hypothetical protein